MHFSDRATVKYAPNYPEKNMRPSKQLVDGMPLYTPSGIDPMLREHELDDRAISVQDAFVEVLNLADEKQRKIYTGILDKIVNEAASLIHKTEPKIISENVILVIIEYYVTRKELHS